MYHTGDEIVKYFVKSVKRKPLQAGEEARIMLKDWIWLTTRKGLGARGVLQVLSLIHI